MQRKFTSQLKKILIVGIAVFAGTIIAKAQTPTVRSYATRQATQLSGIDIGGGVTGAANAVDDDPFTSSNLSIGVGVTATRTQLIDFNPNPAATTSYATTIPANTPITVKFKLPSGLVDALGNLEIAAITDLHQDVLNQWVYTNVGPNYSGSSLTGLISASGSAEFTFTPTSAFQGLRVSINSLVSVATQIDIYDAYIKVPASGNVVCSDIADVLYGVKAGTVVGGITNATGGVTDYQSAVDNSSSTYATLSTGAQVLSQVYYTTVFNTPSKIGDSVKLIIQDASLALLNLSALAGVQVNLYNGSSSSTPAEVVSNNSPLLSLNLLNSGNNLMEIVFVPTVVFDRVELQLGGVAAALQSIRLYEVDRLNAGVALTTDQAEMYRYAGRSFNLAATSIATGDNVVFYDAVSGGNVVSSTSNIATTPAQAGTVLHYYAGTTRNGCSESSGRKEIGVHVVGFTANTPVDGQLGVTYSSSIAVTPASPSALPNTPVYQYTTSSVLPMGVSLNANTGALTGMPTEVNSYVVVDTVDDVANNLRVGVFTNNIQITATPLGISLRSFNAYYSAERKSAIINWEVAADEPLKAFEIQRSEDGKIFKTIGNLAYNKDRTAYEYEDPAFSATCFYRLKVAGISGSAFYSNVVLLKEGESMTDLKLYPNPTNGKELIVEGHDIYKISVVNSAGQEVETVVIYQGNHATVQTSSLSKGFYFLKVQFSGLAIKTLRFINN